LAEYQYHRLSKSFSKVYISAKNNKFNFDVNIIEDCFEEASPLVGLISIFETLNVDEVFILSVDAPFVSQDIIDKLYREAKKESPIIVAESSSGIEPLCGIYRRSILKRAKEALALNHHRLLSLFDDVGGQKVKIKDSDVFMNLNHPEDYEEALKRV
jgi:molybdopterin-guanine dinucleotide biosynthesis protein A